jgi:glutamyl-tRNA synthetase
MGYLLSSVVDDIDLSISHVIRGEDHLHNTARQILLFEALDARLPVFAHLPLLRESEGRKLSKRDPLGTLDAFVDEGFQPRTVRRYLAELLGQGAIDLLVGEGRISLDRIPTGAPRVDRVRIESLGREDMGDLDDATLFAGAGIDADDRVTPIVRELASACHSFVHLRGEMRLVLDGPGPADLPVILRVVAPEEEQMARFDASLELTAAQLRFELEGGPGAGADDVWAVPFVGRIKADGKEHGLGVRDVLQPLRIALTGTAHGPALDLVLTAVGARDALRRIHIARAVLSDVRGAAAPAGG